MSDEAKPEGQEPETPPATTPPAYASMDEFRQLQDRVTGQFEVMMGTLQRLMPQQQQYAPPIAEEMGDEELQQALLTGDVGAVKKLLASEREKIVREYIAPLQQVGISAIADINQKLVKSEMPYYELVQKDMESQLSQVAPELRMQPQVIKHIYNATLGANLDKVVNAAIERKIRSEREGSTQDVAGARTGGQRSDQTVEGYFGEDSLQALRSVGKGMDADSFAKKLGYKDAKEYLEFALKQEQEETR